LTDTANRLEHVHTTVVKPAQEQAVSLLLVIVYVLPNTDFLLYSFSHRASILWNNLPLHLKNKLNLGSFKFALKENSDFLDKITFNGLSGTNKDTVNYVY